MTAVKRITVILISLFCLLYSFSAVSAASSEQTVGGISFTLSGNYKISTSKNLENVNDVEGLVFVAISENGEHQIQCRTTETSFTREFGDFSKLDEESVLPIGKKLFSGEFESVKTPYGVYLKSNVNSDNEDSIVYVTVSNGKLYTFSYFGKDPTRIGEFITTVKLPSSSNGENGKVIAIIIIATVMLIFGVVIFFLGSSFIRDYRRYKMEQSENIVSQYIKIKRRRY